MKHIENQRGGMYSLSEDVEMKAKLSSLTRRLEELEMRNQHEVRAVAETLVPLQPCFNCQSTSHHGEQYPIAPSVRDLLQEQANIVGQSKPPTNAPYGNTYNPNWRNHPNLSWKPKTPSLCSHRFTAATTSRFHFTAAATPTLIPCRAIHSEFEQGCG